MSTKEMKWAYGITSVPERAWNGVLGATLQSLRNAGFNNPRVFIDGDYSSMCLGECTIVRRYPRIGVFGSWYLGMLELYLRDPDYDRYAIFQDDILASTSLRAYLDACPYHE